MIVGKTCELCFIVPEKAVSASNVAPTAKATEPARPDVSMAKINGSCVIGSF